MVSIKIKKRNKKENLYAEYSFRMPNGNIKKLSKFVEKEEDANSPIIKDYFLRKEIEANQIYAEKKYISNNIFTKQKIAKIEAYRVEYKKIMNTLTKKQMNDILDRFTANFTYESNAIEGNSLTLKDVTMIFSENIVPKGKNLREVYEANNTREANELLFNNKLKIDIKDIIKLHSILVKETGVTIGFKNLPNFLLMRNVKTTPPENVEKEMQKLVDWYNISRKNVYPLKIAAEFHGRFEKIHPFEDGNGRVGRILINVILLENNYPPLIIRKTVRHSYFEALSAYDKNHKDKLERFLIEKFEDTFEKFFRIYVKYL
jgi:Fic family protein